MKFDHSNKFDSLFWSSEFATAKIECSFEKGTKTPVEVAFILLAKVQLLPLVLFTRRVSVTDVSNS